MNICCYSIYQK